jgi:WD40 repeat protein
LITTDHSRLIVVLGNGGIGKTTLARGVVDAVKKDFDYIFGRSLLLAPSLKTILPDCIHFLSNQTQGEIPDDDQQLISLLLNHLQKYRCLLIFDSLESIMLTCSHAGAFQDAYKNFDLLLQRLGTVRHQSCLLLTSREQPETLVRLEAEGAAVHSYRLTGLIPRDGRAFLKNKGLLGDTKTREALVKRYAGHPQTLKLIAQDIREFYAGNIAQFLADDNAHLPKQLQDILAEQFERLSSLEQELLYWLAIEREPVSRKELEEDIIHFDHKRNVRESLRSLQRRDLIETTRQTHPSQEVLYILGDVIMEYVTERLIEQIAEEIRTQTPHLLIRHGLVKAHVKDYIRQSQIRFLRQPLAEQLSKVYGKVEAEKKLKSILSTLRRVQIQPASYAASNILNLFVELKTDLRGLNFSQLTIRQAYLEDVSLPGVQFSQANFEKTTFIDIIGITLSVAFSPDGTLLAAGTANSEIRLWDADGNTPLVTCTNHSDWVWSIAFSPDSKLLASGSGDKTVRLWNPRSGQCLRVLRAQNTWFPSVAFSPDGTLLAAGGDDRLVYLWRVADTAQTSPAGATLANHTNRAWSVTTLTGHTDRVWSVAFSPDGRFIASGSADRTIRIWETHSGQCLQIFQNENYPVRGVTFSPDGTRLVSCSGKNDVLVWDLASAQPLQTFRGHSDWLRAVAYSADGQLIASAGEDRTIRLWQSQVGTCQRVLYGHRNRIRSVAFHPHRALLTSVGEDQTIRLWDTHTGQCLKTLHGYAHPIWTVAFSPDGQRLASISEDHLGVQFQLWETNNHTLRNKLPSPPQRIRSVAFSPTRNILACGCEDKTVRIWNINSGHIVKVLEGHTERVWSVLYSPDGTLLASSSEDKTIRIWDTDTDEQLKVLQGHSQQIWTIAFHPRGEILASGSEDHTIRLWNVTSGECLRILLGHSDGLWSLAFSPDGTLLASGSEDKTIRIWDTATGTCLYTLQGHTSRVWSVAFRADGGILASSGEDKTVCFWDLSSGTCTSVLQGHEKQIRSVVAHPRKPLFASGSDDGTIRFWDGQNGTCLAIITNNKPYEHMNITGVQGLTSVQKDTIKALGAIEVEGSPHSETAMQASQAKRQHIFISYSHKDRAWMAKFQTMLSPLIRRGAIQVWSDTQIVPGTRWHDEINKALATAKAALLLVSPEYLASDFIAQHELPPLLEAAQQAGLHILWVAVRASLYEETAIAAYQSLNNPARPLSFSTNQDRDLAEICRKIAQIVNTDE